MWNHRYANDWARRRMRERVSRLTTRNEFVSTVLYRRRWLSHSLYANKTNTVTMTMTTIIFVFMRKTQSHSRNIVVIGVVCMCTRFFLNLEFEHVLGNGVHGKQAARMSLLACLCVDSRLLHKNKVNNLQIFIKIQVTFGEKINHGKNVVGIVSPSYCIKYWIQTAHQLNFGRVVTKCRWTT